MSSILKKMIMALTGLALVGFLITHLVGNLFLFGGAHAFDQYAKKLEDMGPLLIAAEAALLGIFLVHVGLAIKLTLENKAARGAQGYQANDNQSALTSRVMLITGILVLFFVVVHVKMFKFGEREKPATEMMTSLMGEEAGKDFAKATGEQGSLYGLVVKEFKKPGVAIFYVALMFVLGLHLNHGIASALQSLGLLRPGWLAVAKPWCAALGWLIAFGFALLPACAFMGIGIK
ncbi:MAG: hypothetical protein KIS92_21550 [Planctomycetota bacterium]|nr:hypothetical protein [Planctomycetota bacterium]